MSNPPNHKYKSQDKANLNHQEAFKSVTHITSDYVVSFVITCSTPSVQEGSQRVQTNIEQLLGNDQTKEAWHRIRRWYRLRSSGYHMTSAEDERASTRTQEELLSACKSESTDLELRGPKAPWAISDDIPD